MARSRRYVNFSVSITPSGGTAATLAEIMAIKVMRGSKQLAAYGDAKLFPTLIVNVEESRSITLAGGDVSKVLQMARGITYTVVVVLLDAKNGVGSGALTITLTNAVMETDEHSAANNDWGGSSVTFNAYSTDGSTDPMTVAEAV
jgi:hypothetical protein